jgi:hypothetical protein
MKWLKKLKEFIFKKPNYNIDYVNRFCLSMNLLSLLYLFHPTIYANAIFCALLPLLVGLKAIWIKGKEFFLGIKSLKIIYVSMICSILSILLAIIFINKPEIFLTERRIIFLTIIVISIYFLPTLIAYFINNEQISEIFRINKSAYLIFPWFAAMFLLSIDVKKFVKEYIKKGDKKNIVIPRKHKLIIEYESLSKSDRLLVDYLYKDYLNKKVFYRFAEIQKDIKINKSTLSRGLKELLKNKILELVNNGKKRKVYTFSEEFIKQKNIYNSRKK